MATQPTDLDLQVAVRAWVDGVSLTPSRWAHTDGISLYRLVTCIATWAPEVTPDAPLVNVAPLGDGGKLTRLQHLVLRSYPQAVQVEGRAGSSAPDLVALARAQLAGGTDAQP